MLLEIGIILLSALFVYNWWAHGYWKRRNAFSIPKTFLFGNFWEFMMGKKVSLFFCDLHLKYKKHGIIGFYFFYKPMVFISDPEIVNRVLVRDFSSFSDNGFTMDKNVDPIMGNSPFTAKSIPLWKELRSIQATNQTPLKLRNVVPNLAKIGEHMYDFIQKNKPIEVYDFTTRAAVDSALLLAYGLEPKSYKDSKLTFLELATVDELFSATFLTMMTGFFCPEINGLLKLRFTSKKAEDFFLFMTKTNIEHRKNAEFNRGDLFDSILKLNKKKEEQGSKAYSNLEISSHCAVFFMDAIITSSVVFTFVLLELAKHQDIQERLRTEILSVATKPEDFDADKINSIEYLQMVMDETLRLHPPVTLMSRLCTKDIVMNDVKISKGTRVFMSPLAYHYDPDYFPDPEKFDPERFSEINKESMTKYTFLPFGEGPRICVGMKYGTLFVKMSVAVVLLKYKVLPTNDQNKSLHDIDHFLLSPKPNCSIKFEELKS